ncbi:MAG: hypothetical protein K2X66_14085 [Cyanobacteria bacterium]|nr:hypothetical protein [Cyanobacteriota bacterium]
MIATKLRQPFRAGNSLVEYVLPLGIIAVVVLVGTGLVSGNFTQWMPSMSNGTLKNDGHSKSLVLRPLGSNPFTQTIQLTLSDGSSLDLENYPTDIKSLVETLGPNGTTDLLVDAIRQLAQKLLAKGEITQAQANELSALANSGHSWANSQGVIESALRDSRGNKALFESKVSPLMTQLSSQFATLDKIDPEAVKFFNLNVINAKPILDAQGKVMKDAQGNYMYDSNNVETSHYTPLQVSFANSYAQASKSGIFQDPVVKKVVDSLSHNIFQLGSVSINLTTQVLKSQYQFNLSDFNQSVQKQIDGQSSNICAVGGGNDTGVSCPSNKRNRGSL